MANDVKRKGVAEPKAPRWQLACIPVGAAGFDLRERMLNDGWEPFAVTQNDVWLRKRHGGAE